jgi:hypothetical protein
MLREIKGGDADRGDGAAMLSFLLFLIFCVIVWALFHNGRQGVAVFLVITFLVWGFFALFMPAHAAPRTKNPNPYGYYGYNDYSGHYARPRYAPNYSYYCQTPYYVLGYPVPHYGYKGWCFWR